MSDELNKKLEDCEKTVSQQQETIRSLSRTVEVLSAQLQTLREEVRTQKQYPETQQLSSPSQAQSILIGLITGIITTFLTSNIIIGLAVLIPSIFILKMLPLRFDYNNQMLQKSDQRMNQRIAENRLSRKRKNETNPASARVNLEEVLTRLQEQSDSENTLDPDILRQIARDYESPDTDDDASS